jgi:hypothetical protein
LILIEAAPLVNNHSSRPFRYRINRACGRMRRFVQSVPNGAEVLACLLSAERRVSLST